MKSKNKLGAGMILSMLVLSVFSFSMVLAEETVVAESEMLIAENPVSDVDDSLNESVSGWSIAKQTMSVWVTRNQEKKAEKELDLARMRLIQARVAAQNNNTEAMEKALEAHNRVLSRVQNRVKAIEGSNESENAEKLVGLDRAIEVHQIRINRTVQQLEATNLSVQQQERLRSAISKAEESVQNLQNVQEAQMERVRTRMMALSNMSEDEVEATISELKGSDETSENGNQEESNSNK